MVLSIAAGGTESGTRRIEGIVVSPEGDGIGNASIVLSGPGGERVIPVTPDGRFAVTADTGATSAITVRATGFFARRVAIDAAAPRLRIVLAPRPVCAGHLIDQATHQPIAGARVLLRGADGTLLAEAETGAAGDFSFADLDPGAVTLEVHAEGYAALRHSVELPAAESDIVLSAARAIRLAGEVRDGGGQPVAGAEVRAAPIAEGESIDPAAIVAGRSGDAGRFEIGPVPAGATLFVAARTDDNRIAFATVPATENPVRIVASETVPVAVCAVWDESGEPVEALRVVLRSAHLVAERLAALQFLEAGRPASSRCAHLWLPEGRYHLVVFAEGALPKTIEDVHVVPATGPPALGPVRLEPAQRLTLRITDESGMPVAGADVRLHVRAWGSKVVARASSGNDGTAVVADVARGRYSLEVEAPGYRPLWLHAVDVPGPARTVRLRRGGSVDIRAFDAATGAPITSFTASAWPASIDPQSFDARTLALMRPRRSEDGSGHLRIDGLPPGDYLIRARAPGHRSFAEEVHLEAGTAEQLTIEFEPAECARGRVLDAETEEPVPAATIAATESDELADPTEGPEVLTTSGIDGHFEVCEAAEGSRLEVSVSHPDYAPEVVTLHTERERTVLLGPGVGLEGVLLSDEEHVVAGWSVEVSGPGWRRRTTTGDDGRFDFARLPAGRVKLVLGDPLADSLADRETRHLTLEEGKTARARIVLGAAMRGRVLRAGVAVPGAALIAVRIEAVGPGEDPTIRSTRTDDRGEFLLPRMGPGRWVVQVRTDAGVANRIVETDGREKEIDIDIGTLEVTGLVLDGETVDAVANAVVESPLGPIAAEWGILIPRDDGLVELDLFDGDVNVARSGPDGEFRLTIDPRAGGLVVLHPDYLDATLGLEELRAGDVTILLFRGGTLDVSVRDVDGNPCPGRVVAITEAESQSLSTDGIGNARFDALRQGRYDLWAFCPRAAPSHIDGVEIDPEAPTSVTITAGPGTELVVKMPAGSEDLRTRLALRNHGVDLGPWLLPALAAEAEVDREEDGSGLVVRFPRFPSGAFVLTDLESGTTRSFEAVDGRPAVVDLGAPD